MHPLPAIAGGSLPTKAQRARLCVLCGHALRSGQPMLRMHGSTIHARCTNTSHSAIATSPA
jgi:hypothetical protein